MLLITVVVGVYLLGDLLTVIPRRSLIAGKMVFIFLILVTACLFSIPVLQQLRFEDRFDIFAPPIVVFGFLSVPYLLRPLQMALSGDYGLIYPRFSFGAATVLGYGCRVLLYVDVGLAFFMLGYYSSRGERLAASVPAPHAKWDTSRMWSVITLFSLLSIFTVETVVYLTTGSFVEFLQQWKNRVSMLAGYHLFVFLSRAAALGSMAILLHYRSLRPVTVAHLLGATLLVLVFGRRAFALTLVVMFLIVYHYSIDRIKAHRVLSLGVAVFWTASTIRYVRQNGTNDLVTHLLSLPTEFLTLLVDDIGRAFDNFLILLWGISEQWSYQFGTTYLRVPLNFIPRALWPGKPALTVGAEFAARFFPGRPGGVPLGPFALQYLNFHLFGIVVGLFLTGIAYRTLYAYLRQNNYSSGVVLLYAVTIVTFRNGLNNTSLVTWIVTMCMALALLFLLGEYDPRLMASRLVGSGNDSQA